MGSLVEFQDLNLLPDTPNSFTCTAEAAPNISTTPLLRPKIEPKEEPFDEEPLNQIHGVIPVPNWNPNLTPSSSTTPFLEPVDEVVSDSLVPQAVPSSAEGNVFSEFARISEMFKSAFAKRKERYGDVELLDPESGAIVPVATESTIAVASYKRPKRQLRRFDNLSREDCDNYRNTVRQTRMLYNSLRLFDMFQAEKRKGPGMGRRMRSDSRAAALMKDRDLWLHRDKIVGPVPGVSIGDVFFFRMEMCVLGLHSQPQAGIDYLPASESEKGYPVATSIIVSGGYEDDEDSGEELTYSGHGGRDKFNRPCCDQKPKDGNLALLKSMEDGIEIRVIRGRKYNGSKVYVYDGLYKIEKSWCEAGKSGFSVYKYKLFRIEGQDEMGSSKLRFAETLRTRPLELRPVGYLTLDLSLKNEGVPVFLFNDHDSDCGPMSFQYLSRPVFPAFLYQASGNSGGCSCIARCSDDCLCGIKNGGEIPYDHQGHLLRGKPLIFECNANCSCPPNCRNRVSQRGLKHRLEVFRSKAMGWGVRTLDLIPAGSFICEYTGVVLSREQAEVLSVCGDDLIFPGRFASRWTEWGDLSRVFPDYVQPSYPSLPPLDFAMDVSTFRNVAFYMSHSVSPNVLVQFVLYDHTNLMFPHIMLFAMENIPPMKDLTIDYGVPDEYTGKLSICHH